MFRSFEKARRFAHSLKLKTVKEWQLYVAKGIYGKVKRPDDIPTNPYNTYKNKGWISWGDWIGTGTTATHLREYLSFKEARTFVHALKLKSTQEWRKYCAGDIPSRGKLPKYIPSNPDHVYKNSGWDGMTDWLGTQRKEK